MVALTALPGLPAHAVTDPLNVEAHIVAFSLNISATQSLNFGAFTAGPGGTVVVHPLSPTNYNGVTQIPGGPAPQPGSVLLTGLNANATLDITVTDPTITVANTAAQTMVVNGFQIATDTGGAARSDLTLTNAAMPVPIGATLTIPAAQPSGDYTGTFTVQANYH